MREYVDSQEFFDLLYNDVNFCNGLGKIMLAAGMLETNLRTYLNLKGIKQKNKKSTLGALISTLKKNNLLSRNGEMHFEDLKLKRNYLAHSLYDLFSHKIEQTVLPRENLVEMDVEMFAEKAQTLAGDLIFFAKDVQRQVEQHQEQGLSKDQLL